MKILIVYELVPEDTKFYVVEPTDEQWAWMRLTHGRFVNQTMDRAAELACRKLSNWIDENEEARLESESGSPIAVTGFDYVLHTGFIL